MLRILLLSLACLWGLVTSAQSTDTLRFHSKAFGTERTVYVHTPEFYKYTSDLVKLPVIIVLDGQHHWFVNPVLSNIHYLQVTHEIPQALVVVIPLTDRVNECGIDDPNTTLPLHTFITEELTEQLKTYHPNQHTTIIGHSFSASFALYSLLHAPEHYAAVIANSPYDNMDELIQMLGKLPKSDRQKVSISIGGIGTSKDHFHRKKFDELQTQYPAVFKDMQLFIADGSTHNAVPIVAVPSLLTRVFQTFSTRTYSLAEVDLEYKLTQKPGSVTKEMELINAACRLGEHPYALEVAELNGIASRYWNSDYNDHAAAVFQLGTELYPRYYDFYLSLYDIYSDSDPAKAKQYLLTCRSLLAQEPASTENIELLNAIDEELGK